MLCLSLGFEAERGKKSNYVFVRKKNVFSGNDLEHLLGTTMEYSEVASGKWKGDGVTVDKSFVRQLLQMLVTGLMEVSQGQLLSPLSPP